MGPLAPNPRLTCVALHDHLGGHPPFNNCRAVASIAYVWACVLCLKLWKMVKVFFRNLFLNHKFKGLSASGDCRPRDTSDKELCWGKWEMVKELFRNVYLCTCSKCRRLHAGDFIPLNPWPGSGFASGPHAWGKLSDHFTGSLQQACSKSSKLYFLYTFSINTVLPLQPCLHHWEKHQ